MRKSYFTIPGFFILFLTILSGNTPSLRGYGMVQYRQKLQTWEHSNHRVLKDPIQYPQFLEKLKSLKSQEDNSPERSSRYPQYYRTDLLREPPQILVNGSDSTSIIQWEDMLITVSFSEGSSEADVNMWIDLNADALWEPETDIDLEESLHIVDNDANDEDPTPGIYQFNFPGSAGVSMIANLGILVTVEDSGGTDAAFVYIQPNPTDYSVSGQITPAFSNLLILAVSLDVPSQEPWITVSNSSGSYEAFVPAPGYYLIALIDFLNVLESDWIPETNYVEYISGHLTGYDFQMQPVIGEITGQLTDQDELPMDGIEIHVVPADAPFPFPLAMTDTDNEGNYTLGVYAGDWIVRVNSDYLIPDYLVPPPSDIFTISSGDTVIQDFQIYAVDSYISGTVFLDDVVYEEGVEIMGDSELGSVRATTEANGMYLLPVSGLADQLGGYSVSVDESALPDGLSPEEHYEGVISGSSGIDFHLITLTGGVSGFIFDAVTLDPVAGIQLHLIETDTAQHFSGTSDDSGYFDIPLPTGSFNMLIFPEGYYNQMISDITVTDTYVQQTVYLEPLILTGSIFGYVTELTSGNPLNDVPVSVSTGFDSSWFAADTVTDGTGYFSFEVPNGTFFVQATLEGWTEVGNSPAVVENDQVQHDVILAFLSGAIHGMVTDGVTGLPVPGVWIYADNGTQNWGNGSNSAENGTYAIPLINGVYNISSELEGYMAFSSEDIEVQDEDVTLDIALTPTVPPQVGDINGDQALNVLDVVLIVGFILGDQEPSPLQAWAADVTGDGTINVLDIVSLVDLILNG